MRLQIIQFLGLYNNEQVAVRSPKCLTIVELNKFYREIRIILGLNHDNIIKSHGYYLQPLTNKPHLILEFMELGDLNKILKSGKICGTLLRQVIFCNKSFQSFLLYRD